MPTAKKAAVIEDLTEKLGRANAAALIEYRGLTVAEIGELRNQLRPLNVDLHVTKNTLLREAAHRSNLTELDHLFVGPTAVAFMYEDEAAGTKALNTYFRTARVGEIKSGILKGGRSLTGEQFAKLADLPNRQTLLAQIAGLLQSPLSQLATLFNAPAQQLAYALAAFEEKGGAAGAGINVAATPEAAEAPAPAATEAPAPAAEVESAAEAPAVEAATEAPAAEAAAEAPEAAAEPVQAEVAAADTSSAPESEGGAAYQAAASATEETGEPESGQAASEDVASAPESEGSADAQP